MALEARLGEEVSVPADSALMTKQTLNEPQMDGLLQMSKRTGLMRAGATTCGARGAAPRKLQDAILTQCADFSRYRKLCRERRTPEMSADIDHRRRACVPGCARDAQLLDSTQTSRMGATNTCQVKIVLADALLSKSLASECCPNAAIDQLTASCGERRAD